MLLSRIIFNYFSTIFTHMMKDASDILFKELYHNQPLFRNQLELVLSLLSDKESKYYVEPKNKAEFQKTINSLKVYISQLLSSHVTRTLNDDFKRSLEVVLKKKLKKYPQEDVENILIGLFEDLAAKNQSLPTKIKSRSESYDGEDLFEEIKKSRYILVVTARPIEITYSSKNEKRTLHDDLVNQLFISLCSNSTDSLKYYRFNFPLPEFGKLFWKAARWIIFQKLKTLLSQEKNLKLILKNPEISHIISKSPEIHDDNSLIKLTDEILLHLNEKKYLLVFYVDDAIFTVPLIVANPNDIVNSKVFLIINSENKEIKIQKLCKEDCISWNYFVWNRLKSGKAGTPINYKTNILQQLSSEY